MQDNPIDIFIAAGDTAPPYAVLLRQTMSKLASRKNTLSFKCVVNSKKFTEIDGWKTVCIHESNIDPNFKAVWSWRHGDSLNQIYDHISGSYVLICDADTVVLQKDWDVKLLSMLQGVTACAGVTSSKRGGLQGKSSKKNQRLKDVPCLIFSIFRSKFLIRVRPDLRPALLSNGGILNKKVKKAESLIWKVPQGSKLSCDTGWRIIPELRSRGYRTCNIEHEDNLNLVPLKEPYEVWYCDNAPLVAHATSSRFRGENDFLEWASFVDNLIKKAI